MTNLYSKMRSSFTQLFYEQSVELWEGQNTLFTKAPNTETFKAEIDTASVDMTQYMGSNKTVAEYNKAAKKALTRLARSLREVGLKDVSVKTPTGEEKRPKLVFFCPLNPDSLKKLNSAYLLAAERYVGDIAGGEISDLADEFEALASHLSKPSGAPLAPQTMKRIFMRVLQKSSLGKYLP